MAELTSQPISIQSVYGWYAEGRLFVNRRYQRKLVWTLEEKQKLVESILKKYPIPAILIAEREHDAGRYEIIDGLQRLNAILSFIEGSFSTIDGRFFSVSAFPTAQGRSDEGLFQPISQDAVISQKEVTTILDYSLALSIMRRAEEREIDDVFDRINSYGHRLSDQERRQAGIQNEFSELVRKLACTLRGDESENIMPLSKMPEISIDLPMTKHGYSVRAEEVFWVNQGVLRATDLRDSMDEQCIADIAASVILGNMVERSKETLDEFYHSDTQSSKTLLGALNVYGSLRFVDEFKFCVDRIVDVCNAGNPEKLRSIIFEQRTTNAFPAVFSVIFAAFHELIVKDKKKIYNYATVKKAITNLTKRIDTTRRATAPDERRKNVDTIKGLIASGFIDGDLSAEIYSNHSSADIDASIRRSEIELNYYELKQGIVSLGGKRDIDEDLLGRIHETICGIANNGPDRAGKIILGVADKEKDAHRVKIIDGVEAKIVGSRFVVGVKRESTALNITLEKYHAIIRESIEKSALSEPLKGAVLSSIDFNAYYGFGVVVIGIPPQREPSFVGNKMYWRDGDSTKLADNAKLISDIGRRF
jgi:Protein of unknown function DUF262